jgi:hypothetical protein
MYTQWVTVPANRSTMLVPSIQHEKHAKALAGSSPLVTACTPWPGQPASTGPEQGRAAAVIPVRVMAAGIPIQAGLSLYIYPLFEWANITTATDYSDSTGC